MEEIKGALPVSEEKTVAGLNRRKTGRIWEIDFLRGLCILIMLFDHLMYILGFIFWWKWLKMPLFKGSATERICKFARDYYNLPAHGAAQVIVAGALIFLSGISSGLSKNNLKRGIKLAVCAGILTLITLILGDLVQSDVLITFGVLHMLAVSMILLALLELLFKCLKIDKGFKYTSTILIAVIGGMLLAAGIPYAIEPAPQGGWLKGALVYSQFFPSIDYFALLPWSGVMFLGAAFGKMAYKNKKGVLGKYNDTVYKYTAPINYVGKNSIWVYMLHFAVIFMLLYFWGLIFGLWRI